ncbi:MAG: hypothetical protein ACXVR9_09360 [Gaiellaceae bacterium]
MSPTTHVEELPRREVLQTLARHYHHLQNEHKRAGVESGVRRRIEEQLLQVRERFDRLLEEWVPDTELQQAWREHLHNRVAAPAGPAAIRPLVFRGRSEAAAVVEVRGKGGDELEVEIDGSVVARIAGEKDFTPVIPTFRWRFDGVEFEELFDVSSEALDALADSLREDQSPPWEHAAELLADGLIDTHAALTPRGRRALSRRQ